MTPTQRYLFDLQGFIILRNVLSQPEVDAANAAITANEHHAKSRTNPAIRNTASNTPLSGDGSTGRVDLGKILQFPNDESKVFRSILNHPTLLPFFNSLLGPGYRLDHSPLVLLQQKGSEGFSLHGGTTDVRSGEYNHHLEYSYKNNGVMRCNLLACEVILTPHPKNRGGWCVVPGSHKSNLNAPLELIDGGSEIEGEGMQDVCVHPEVNPGDVILFSEGTVHGATSWKNDFQRRVALYRFAPCYMGYGRSYFGEDKGNTAWPEGLTDGMTEGEKAVCLQPFASHLERPVNILADDGASTEVKVGKRKEEKKAFDREVFGTEYF